MVEAAVGSRAIYWGNIGIMEKKMETLGPSKRVYRGYIGIMGYILG